MSYSRAEEAILKFQKGDKEALEVIYNVYKAPLYQFIFRYTNNEQLSIDLVQDTFEKLQRNFHQFDQEKGKFKTYLYQIAYNTMMTRLRRQNLFRNLLPILADRHPHHENSDEKITVQSAIQSLPEDLRAIVLLTYYHDLTQKEISMILHIPVGTVKSKLHRALKKLKEELEVNED
ncbi:RNA polymerase sigma factor [Fredinandcohnia sp. QZ13]|uniref:RNA polymerase sigma factor n=1 Tax=Fredinandcohnia sp. QZ13 TaxID=3073144 RepID=UPI0028535FA9|nr:RNA polymerase sigma factor [Fredinandcohnia sp. QZ13]MDR4889911.1 RNA polymerase sigma factor [Fredinandcohnia sp. QZ13]